MSTTPVSIVCAKVGDVEVAFAADAVSRMVDDTARLPHLASLLSDSAVVPPGGQCRALCLVAGERETAVRVDGPVRFASIVASDLLAAPASLPARSIAFALGFARLDGELVLLLDAPRVAAAVLAAADSAREGVEESS